MTHRQKVERLVQELRQQGVSPYTTAPPLFRLLWALGVPVPPPFFIGFLPLTLLMGVPFGVLWGAAMWLLQWQSRLPAEAAALTAAAAGLFFGLGMAGYVRWKAARLG